MAGPRDPAGAGRDRFRAGHADRERAIEALKSAFVDGRLTKDELAARTGRALAARTCADLAALTADLPAGLAAVEPIPAVPAPAEVAAAEAVPASQAKVVRGPMARAAVASGICLVVAAAATILFALCHPEAGSGPPSSWAGGFFILAVLSVMTAVTCFGFGITYSIQERLSRRQLPPRPPGGRALGGEQHGDVAPGPALPGYRTDETQTDLRARKPRQHGRRSIPARTGRAAGGVRPATGTA
jgi:DUF1707 SHOCT-like domain